MAKGKPKAKKEREIIIPPDEATGSSKDNPRKRAFARAYVDTGQASVAYIQAGYTGDPNKHASTLLKDPFVYKEIERLYRELDVDTLVTTRYVISNLRRAADITGQVRFNPVLSTYDMLDVGAHLRANQMLGQYLGIFREKIDLGVNLQGVLDALPDPTPDA